MNSRDKRFSGISAVHFAANSIFKSLEPAMLFIFLLVLWCFAPDWLHRIDETAGSVDQSIWLLVLLSMISFLLICTLSWWLLQHFWSVLGLPTIHHMVSEFNTISLCYQLSFYWSSFALLLLTALGCLMAIC